MLGWGFGVFFVIELILVSWNRGMMMNKTKWGLLGALALGCLPAQAALIDRGSGLIYDDVLDVT